MSCLTIRKYYILYSTFIINDDAEEWSAVMCSIPLCYIMKLNKISGLPIRLRDVRVKIEDFETIAKNAR